MAVRIRLARMGTNKTPFYRIVVADERSPRGGRFIERVGTWDPRRSELRVEGTRIQHWLAKGARPSHTLSILLKNANVMGAGAAAAEAQKPADKPAAEKKPKKKA